MNILQKKMNRELGKNARALVNGKFSTLRNN